MTALHRVTRLAINPIRRSGHSEEHLEVHPVHRDE
jgi:hypothetical protein